MVTYCYVIHTSSLHDLVFVYFFYVLSYVSNSFFLSKHVYYECLLYVYVCVYYMCVYVLSQVLLWVVTDFESPLAS